MGSDDQIPQVSSDDERRSAAALARLAALHPKLIDLGLERTFHLLAKLGNPHHKLPPTVHVAGTNGKGSTCAFIDSVARATGTRTGLFTSPHLIDYPERIRVSGMEIEREEIALHLSSLREMVAQWGLRGGRIPAISNERFVHFA